MRHKIKGKRYLYPLVAFVIALVVLINYIPQEAYIMVGKPSYIVEAAGNPASFNFSPYGNYVRTLSSCSFNISEKYAANYTLWILGESMYAEPDHINSTVDVQDGGYFITISPVINVSEYTPYGWKQIRSVGNPWAYYEPNGSINSSVVAGFFQYSDGPDPFYWNHVEGKPFTAGVFLDPGYYQLTVLNVLAVHMPQDTGKWYQNGTTWFSVGGYEATAGDIEYPGLWF